MKPILWFLILTSASSAHAWGDKGHRVVGEIAERHLEPCVRRAVHSLLEGESLAEASTWADDIKSRSEYRRLSPLHFASIPKGSRYEDSPKNPDGDVVEAIKDQIGTLGSAASRSPAKAQAVRLLAHFVGDIHQPFHAGSPEDRGGNSVEVIWFGKKSNLHSVWDSGFLEKLGLSYSELVRFLDRNRKEYPAIDRKDPQDWADESSRLAAEAYAFEPAPSNAVNRPDVPRLSFQYYDKHIGTQRIRLWQAGRRLALLLNETIRCPPQAKEKK